MEEYSNYEIPEWDRITKDILFASIGAICEHLCARVFGLHKELVVKINIYRKCIKKYFNPLI